MISQENILAATRVHSPSNAIASPCFVSAEAARAVFKWEDGIRRLQAVYDHPFEAAATPPRTVARGQGAQLRCLPAIPPGSRYFGAKLMGVAFGGTQKPSMEYVIVMFDRQTSRIGALIDGNLVTAYRTAATSAAALDRLAKPGPARLGVLGSGLEASMHVRAFAAVRPLERVRIFSPTAARREALANELSTELSVPCTAVASAKSATADANIVLAAARSRGELPILFGDWLAPGATVVSIGSTVPEQREIDVSVIDRCDLIICDALEEVLNETGDMLAAAQAGVSFRDKSFSLNALMRGEIDDRRAAATMPMFKSVGGGVQDVAVAELILLKAIDAGLHTPLPIEFLTKS